MVFFILIQTQLLEIDLIGDLIILIIVIKSKDKYKEEWRKFWSNPDIPNITKIFYGMEFELVRECWFDEEKTAIIDFFKNKSQYFPLISKDIEEINIEELFIVDFWKEFFINRWKIASYFHTYTLKSILGLIGSIASILVLNFILKLNLISIFLSEDHVLVNIFLLLGLVGILFLIGMYSSSRIGDRDIYFKKVQQFHKLLIYFILPIFISTFLIYMIINRYSNLNDLESIIVVNQFVYLLLLDFTLFSFLLTFPIYLIEKEKKSQYYLFRFLNLVKNCNEVNEKYILLYFKEFIVNFNQSLKNSTDLIIANINEIENKFYQSFFSGKLEVLEQFANKFEEIILKQDNYSFFEFKFSTLKEIISTINNFFKDLKIPEITFKKYSLIDFILDSYKKISVIIMFLIAIITTIISFLSLII